MTHNLETIQHWLKRADIAFCVIMLALSLYYFYQSDSIWIAWLIGAVVNLAMIRFDVSRRLQQALIGRFTR